MTSRPDPDPEIAAWLHDEAPVRAPEHLLTSSRDRIQSTHQRRAWWPAWRLRYMNKQISLIGGLAAIAVVVAVLGFILIPGLGGVGGQPVPSASPTPTPTAAPSSSPAVISTVGTPVIPSGSLCSNSSACLTGALQGGTYSFDAGTVQPVKVTFTVPAGWTTDQGFVQKNFQSPNEVVFLTYYLTDFYTDACHWYKSMVTAGTTVNQLTNLLVAQKGRVASTPTTVTIGGYPAKQIALTVPASLDLTKCDSGLEHFWPDPGGNAAGGLCCEAAGSTDVVDVLNPGGKTFVVVARHAAGASPADLAELNSIVASITFQLPPSSPSPSGASPSP